MRRSLLLVLVLWSACKSGPQLCDGPGPSASQVDCRGILPDQGLPSGRCDDSIHSCSDCEWEYPVRCTCEGGSWQCRSTFPYADMAMLPADFSTLIDLSTAD